MNAEPGRDWWIDAFRRSYIECYSHRGDASAEREVEFVVRAARIGAGTRVLDAGCGAGRHARALARRGARVVGVDRSADLLARAASAGEGPRYVLADVRSLPLRAGAFDAAVSLFTSFGYFDAAGDRAHLGEMRRVLREDGVLVLDFLNAPRVERELVPLSQRRVGEHAIRETRAVRGLRVEKEVEVRDVAGTLVAQWSESVRLYGRRDLRDMLHAAKFTIRSEHGDLAGGPWTPESERFVVVAEAL